MLYDTFILKIIKMCVGATLEAHFRQKIYIKSFNFINIV